MSQTKVQSPFITNNANFKNLIINGEMQVTQKADTSVHNNGLVRPVDMWKQEASNCDNLTGTLAIDSSVPAGYGFSGSLRFDTTTAESALASDENVKLVTDVEAQNAHHLCYGHADAKKTVLSWWSKSNLSGSSNKFVINVSAPDGSRHISKTFFHASANTWENFTFVIDGDSSGTINDDNGVGLTLTWVLAAGSDYTSTDSTSWVSTSSAGLAYQQTANITSSTSNDFYITGVQLEVGEVATDFEHLPFDVQFHRCQRYFQKITHRYRIVTRWNNNSGVPIGYMDFMQTMNHEPTVTNSGTYEDGSGYGQTPSYGGTTENGTYIAGAVSVSTNETNYIHNGVSEMDAQL